MIPPGVFPQPGGVDGGPGPNNGGGDPFGPYGPGNVPDHCEPIQIELCQSPEIPYNYTMYPVPYGMGELSDQSHAMYEAAIVERLVESGCSPVMRFFTCVALAPMCNPLGRPIPPCR